MKTITLAALVAAQILAAAPAGAAELLAGPETASSRLGSFAGARLRVDLGGKRDAKPRLGLTVAPLRQVRAGDGATRVQFGEGVELGLTGGERPALRVAGRRLAPNGELVDEDGKRLGVSTLEAAGIAAGVIVAGFLVVALAFRSDADD